MTSSTHDGAELGVSIDNHVAVVEIRRPPYNFFDIPMIAGIAEAFESLDLDPDCRAIVLCSQGTAFCAGANFSNRDATPEQRSPRAVNPIYNEAIRLFSCSKPVVAAVHGAAIGGGLGLALVADFRVTCAEARYSANFNRLGFHPGFGLSVTLPRLVGPQRAAMLLYTGRRVGGEEAVRTFARRRIDTILDGVAPAGSDDDSAVEDAADRVAEALTRAGYATTTTRVGGPVKGIQICQHQCPVSHVAEEFPELCEAEQQAISEVLGTHVQQLASIANGDCACTTHIPLHLRLTPAASASDNEQGAPA
jgi:enoyl-CoA hydratase/carnithine racemase